MQRVDFAMNMNVHVNNDWWVVNNVSTSSCFHLLNINKYED